MSLEIKCHTVPCLKALCNGFEICVRQQHDSTFRWFHNYMKLPFLLHTEAIGPYSSSETVFIPTVQHPLQTGLPVLWASTSKI